MKDTGRICQTLDSELQKIIYGENSNEAIDGELKYVVKVDKAHILMLYRKKIITEEKMRKLLNQIEQLEKNDFKPLRNQSTPRGIYFSYEDYLRDITGDECGGMLQFGRSRNDLKATVLRIKIRKPYLLCINKIIKLIDLLLQKSNEFSDVIMPAYTHYQPAVPITYGHYLAAIAEEFMNIAEDILLNKEIEKSPLGSGAVGGTTVSIDTEYTARLLGFSGTVNNSIVGIGSRKVIQDLMSVFIEVESLISRCCEDYLLWTSSDLHFIELPDHLVGGSSMMPNKRNAFLFENIRGRCSKALGAYVSAITAMKGEPFTNSIAVGTEAVAYIWDVFKNTYEIVYMFEKIVADAKPLRKKMLEKNKEGYTLATEYANKLTLEFGVDFRSAHKLVGSFVKESIDTGAELEELISCWMKQKGGKEVEFEMNIQSVVERMNYGWGPGKESCKDIGEKNCERISAIKELRNSIEKRWAAGDAFLLQEIQKAMEGGECENNDIVF